jgi:hypothetical protein
VGVYTNAGSDVLAIAGIAPAPPTQAANTFQSRGTLLGFVLLFLIFFVFVLYGAAVDLYVVVSLLWLMSLLLYIVVIVVFLNAAVVAVLYCGVIVVDLNVLLLLLFYMALVLLL